MDMQKTLHLYKEEEKKKPNINADYLMSEKLDGWYVYADYSTVTGWSNIHSSAGREIPSMLWMRREVLPNLPSLNYPARYIFEATIDGIDFHTANGRFNTSVNNYEERTTILNLHDIIPLTNFSLTALDRYGLVRDTVNQVVDNRIRYIKSLGISSEKTVWMQKAEEIWERDGEGLILKRVDSVYMPGKRNATLMKIKLENEFDLLVVKMYWTKGEKGNDNLNLDLQNKAGVITPVRVGKHKDIAAFTLESPVGKVATIKCMKELETGGYREPRFKHIRFDKLPHEID